MTKNFDIIIIGGGIVGASFALDLSLRKPKFNIAIIDKYDFNNINIDNRVYAISANNILKLQNMNVLPSDTANMSKINIYTDKNGFINLDSKLINKSFLAKIVNSSKLYHNLISNLKLQDNITLITDNLKNVDNAGKQALIKGDNDVYACQLMVGADGGNSWLKNQLLFTTKCTDYKQYGIVANLECQFDHFDKGVQWFNNNDLLAFLPLNEKRISIVWSTFNYQQLLSLSDEDFIKLLTIKSNNLLGNLKLLTKPIGFPLKMYSLDNLTCNKTVLIGDAAHTVHPLAGQGINLGLNDAKVLVNILANKNNYQLSDKSILVSYNNLRIPQVKFTQFYCDFFYRINVSNNFIKKLILNTGFNFFDRSNFLKRTLLEYLKNQ